MLINFRELWWVSKDVVGSVLFLKKIFDGFNDIKLRIFFEVSDDMRIVWRVFFNF